MKLALCVLSLFLAVSCSSALNNVDRESDRGWGDDTRIRNLIDRISPWRPWPESARPGSPNYYSQEDFGELVSATCAVSAFEDDAIAQAIRPLDLLDDHPWYTYDGRLFLLVRMLYRVPRTQQGGPNICRHPSEDLWGVSAVAWPILLDRTGLPIGVDLVSNLALKFPIRAEEAFRCYARVYGRRWTAGPQQECPLNPANPIKK